MGGSANPSLWRHARLNAIHGLFEVSEGIYQVRAFDVSNVTFIAGDTGWIVVDPLTNVETARAAFAILDKHHPGRPIHAVIYTHSHVDHFGGVQGMVSVDEVRGGLIRGASVRSMIEQMSLPMLFDAMGVRINGTRASQKNLKINWDFSDTGEQMVVRIENGTLSYLEGGQADDADATLRLARSTLTALASAPPSGVADALSGAELELDGPRPEAVFDFFGLLDPVNEKFPIVTP